MATTEPTKEYLQQSIDQHRTNFILVWEAVASIAHQNALSNGFWDQERNNGEMIALCHSELSEALEALRHNIQQDDKIPRYSGVEAELADTIIRIMDMAVGNGWDVPGALLAKIVYNLDREYKHGKEF
jgi:NTP pyrophosphatase (non-canonical NTP hydrolase)